MEKVYKVGDSVGLRGAVPEDLAGRKAKIKAIKDGKYTISFEGTDKTADFDEGLLVAQEVSHETKQAKTEAHAAPAAHPHAR